MNRGTIIVVAAIAVGAFVMSCSPAPETTQQKLSAADYVQRGIPAPDRPWAAQDYETAARVLATLPDSQLPRTSGDSSAIFVRLVDPTSIKACGVHTDPMNVRMPQCIKLLDSAGKIMRRYGEAQQRNAAFSEDVIRLMGAMLLVSEASIRLTEEFVPTIDRNDPKYATRMEGLEKMKSGLAQVLQGCIVTLREERRLYSDASRAELAKTVTRVFPTFAGFLAPLSRTEFETSLKALALTDPSPEVRAALAPFANAPVGAN